jgi:hypothetical protein
MRSGAQIAVSLLSGWAIYLIFLAIVFESFIAISKPAASVPLWNVTLFVAVAGNGPLLGYDTSGNPMYEGTPVHLVFALVGLSSGFCFYPTLIFVGLKL